MFENLYDNIGNKIKGLAKTAFIVEAIGAVVTGLVLLFTDEDLILCGFLTLICGPIIAWVSSWILYAFGELVERTCNNESNTRMIVKLLKEKYDKKTNIINSPTYNASSKQMATSVTGNCESKVDNSCRSAQHTVSENNTIICSLCNFEQPANRKVCWHCGAKFEESNRITTSHQWLCDGCKKMRTQSPCEHCGKE